MQLYELAYTCRLFGELAPVDSATVSFDEITGGRLDLSNPAHAKALLVWLNKWGCRQFAIEHHGAAARMFADWGDQWDSKLPARTAALSKLSDAKLAVTADAFGDLRERAASQRILSGGRVSTVTVGATGAAKALHALRPATLPPWDDPMRAALGLDGTRDSYLEYLLLVQATCRSIEAEAALQGIAQRDIPKVLGRPRSSLPKMIDEHYWITLTRGHVPPSPADLERWNEWAR